MLNIQGIILENAFMHCFGEQEHHTSSTPWGISLNPVQASTLTSWGSTTTLFWPLLNLRNRSRDCDPMVHIWIDDGALMDQKCSAFRGQFFD